MQEKALAQQRKGAAARQNRQGPGQQNDSSVPRRSKPIANPHWKPRKKLDKARQNTAWVLVIGPPTSPWNSNTQHDAAAQDYFGELLSLLKSSDPQIILKPKPFDNRSRPDVFRQPPDLDLSDDPTSWPTTRWDLVKYSEGLFFRRMGGSTEFIIAVAHDSTPVQLVDSLNELQPGVWAFKRHAIQTWECLSCCWLGGSNEFCDRARLASAIWNHTSFQHLRQKHPNEGIHIQQNIIKIFPSEAIESKDRVHAMHVICSKSLGNQVL